MFHSGHKRLYLICGVGLLLMVVVYFLTRSDSNEDPDPDLARIDKMERKRDVSGLAAAVSGGNEKVIGRAMLALATVDAKTAREKIEPLLTDSRPGMQQMAVRLYGRVADRNNVGPLISLYRSTKDPALKASVAAALGEARGWEAVEVLIPSLNDPDPLVRQAAAGAIGNVIGARLNFQVNDPPAKRQQAIARLQKDLPNFKNAYDAYWQRNK
jgi:HEAT repeat protein